MKEKETQLSAKQAPIKPKILIGCVTYFKHAHVLDLLVASIKSFKEYAKAKPSEPQFDFDILFIDNSPGKTYKKVLEKKMSESGLGNNVKCIIIHDPPEGKNRIDRIISGRNIIRNIFLKNNNDNNDYTHLFFLDTDVIAPPFTITWLIKQINSNKEKNIDIPIIAGVYISEQELPNGKKAILPVIYVTHEKEGQARQLRISEVFEPGLMKVSATGLGCVLINRKVIEKMGFRNIGSSINGGEDIAFYIDAKKQGFNLYVDTLIKCDHYLYPFGDKRNVCLMFSKYRKKQAAPNISYSFSLKE